MPYSGNQLDKYFLRSLPLIPVETHLDIGVGAGKYGLLVARQHPKSFRVGVEVWEPYLNRFNLSAGYQELRVMPAARLMDTPDQAWDLVTCGDVLEHMPKSAAIDLIEWLIYRSKAIWIQVPRRYLQGSWEGNPFEAHVSQWSARDFQPYEGIVIEEAGLIGVWLWGWRSDYADWYAWAHGLNCAAAPSINAARAIELRDAFGLKTFIETGIWHGGTTGWAVRNFEQVIACDIDAKWTDHARNRFREVRNLRIVTGDSRPFVLNTLYDMKQPALLYLDAHFIADQLSAGDPNDCPLIGELNAVRVAPQKHVVVIDDARLIVNRVEEYLAWPTLEQVQEAIPDWDITLEGNALVCLPKEA